MTTLAQLKAKAEAARDRFEESRKSLFRGDGSKVYGDAEHEERLAKLRRERNEELNRIEAEMASSVEATNKELAALENGDVTAWLSEPELQRAGTRQTLITADVKVLNREDIKERLSAVRHNSDWASKFCYWLAARERVNGGKDAEMLAILDDLKESIIPDTHRSKIEAARRELETAPGKVRSITYLARREMSGALGGYAPNYIRPPDDNRPSFAGGSGSYPVPGPIARRFLSCL